MQYTDTSSNCSALVYIKSKSDQRLSEHGLTTVDNVKQCFIAVQPGEYLTVYCEVDLGSEENQVDLIVDGILRDSIYHKASKLNNKKTLIFQYGMHKVERKTWRGELIVSKCDEFDKGKRYSWSYFRNNAC